MHISLVISVCVCMCVCVRWLLAPLCHRLVRVYPKSPSLSQFDLGTSVLSWLHLNAVYLFYSMLNNCLTKRHHLCALYVQ